VKIPAWFGCLAANFAEYVWYESRPDWPKFIESMKGEIRHEYSNRQGVRVVDVQFVKESNTKLTGFVKLKVNDTLDVVHSCTVTVADDGQNSIWRCGR
jgi:hypothetical protein